MPGDHPSHDYRPKYYEMLTTPDQEQYNDLRSTLSSQMCRNRRGKRLEGFAEMLNSIRVFCIRHDEDDWKRCLVCGVCWLPNGIAINNRQLSILIDKCKSSINGSLQKMGYSTLQSRNESSGSLSDAIPLLKNNFNELREWTVRLFMAATPQPNLPMYSVNTIYPFQSPVPSQYQAFSIQPRIFMPQAQFVQPAPPPLPPPRAQQQSIVSFFDDDIALPPVFLADDGEQQQVGQPPENNDGQNPEPDLRLSPGDPLFQPDDAFGLYGDKW
jgi:hypothetical protein